ncbi:AraC family transcriptional regulator [Pricia sp. S334]|uniref:AraC family transcriptional regulator n=1 Tax=Pricia mediterranea TaxID=3076079 RepID=A0ABU3L251_9FLAO|nr:AraC family transcriptional regulator [Pricia sp. S334]MDT7827797.1 AraC family transcriptional regulator [Pricia sp. S334]
MKTLRLTSKAIEKNINTTNISLGGSVSSYDDERVLEFDNDFGSGSIMGIQLDGGFSFLQYDVCFREDFKISTDSAPLKPIFFMYCLKGSVQHSYGGTNTTSTLDEFQTAILGGAGATSEITFTANRRVKLCVIRVVDDASIKDTKTLRQQMYSLFAKGKEESLHYFGTYNIRIGEQLAQIGKINQRGIVKKLLVEGILNLTLAMEIEHLQSDLKEDENPTGSLTKYELNSIVEISRKIEKHPEIQYSIKSICTECGLSASKLQEGFKLLHDKTVSDFIRNERLNKAERLITTTDMNISEIVYTVGLSSRSYFSKIFKRRYKCSPKMYQDNKKAEVEAVTA